MKRLQQYSSSPSILSCKDSFRTKPTLPIVKYLIFSILVVYKVSTPSHAQGPVHCPPPPWKQQKSGTLVNQAPRNSLEHIEILMELVGYTYWQIPISQTRWRNREHMDVWGLKYISEKRVCPYPHIHLKPMYGSKCVHRRNVQKCM